MALRLLAANLYYADRATWGADASLGRLGWTTTRAGVEVWRVKDTLIPHHTVIIDPDATPLIFESFAECFAKQRRLQTIRPDLAPIIDGVRTGPDVPYNDVVYRMTGGIVLVCEGRGYDRVGAHTHAYNTKGYGLAWQGNYQRYAVDHAPWLPAENAFIWHVKREWLPNLTRIRPHRFMPDNSTLCPGENFLPAVDLLLLDPPATGDDMDQETRNRLAVLDVLRARIFAAQKASTVEKAWAHLVINDA